MPTPVGLDPDAALVDESESGRIGVKVLGGQPCDCVVGGLRRCVEDSTEWRTARLAASLLVCGAGFQLCWSHLNSTPGARPDAADDLFASNAEDSDTRFGWAEIGLQAESANLLNGAEETQQIALQSHSSFIGSTCEGLQFRARMIREPASPLCPEASWPAPTFPFRSTGK